MLRFNRLSVFQKVFCIVRRNFTRKMDSSKMMKPPNVLIFTGDKHFDIVSENLKKCLHPDKYVFYPFKHSQVLTTPWKENTILVVIYCENVDSDSAIYDEFFDFLKKGGKMLIICSRILFHSCCAIKEINENFIKVQYKGTDNLLYSEKYVYGCSDQSTILATFNKEECAAILKVPVEKGEYISCTVHLFLNSALMNSQLEKSDFKDYNKHSLVILKSLLNEHLNLEGPMSELPSPLPGYVIADSETRLKDMMERLNLSEISLGKMPKEINQSSVLKVPLLEYSEILESGAFDKVCYFCNLKTSYFGKTVVFFPVVTSTMYPAEQLSHLPGVVVVANRQLSGKGTRSNVWISPEGSAAFTLHFPLMLSSSLGRRLSLLQHMASLAVVHGLRKQPGYKNLELCLKWPNDIYYRSDRKIGGVLVNTTIQGEVVNIFVGIGVNVSNERPTTCVNSIIEDHNIAECDSLSPYKTEEVIAKTLTELESIINEFKNSGPKTFLDLYYKYWIHKNQTVTLAESNQSATVESIDDYGFLIVQTADGKKLSLQPDGNRFDLMKNLIITKEL